MGDFGNDKSQSWRYKYDSGEGQLWGCQINNILWEKECGSVQLM